MRQRKHVPAARRVLLRLREHGRRGLGFWGGGGVELGTQGPGWGLNKGRRPTWACVPGLEGRRDPRRGSRLRLRGGRETELAAGPGPSAGWGSGRRWRVGPAGQGGRRAVQASGRLRERGCGAGRVGAGYWPWAELGRSAALGRAWGVGAGLGREERVGLGSGLLGFGSWVSFLFYFLFFSFSKSISNKVLNSNMNLNSNHTQIKVCTSMNATRIFKPMIKF